MTYALNGVFNRRLGRTLECLLGQFAELNICIKRFFCVSLMYSDVVTRSVSDDIDKVPSFGI